MAGLTKLSIQRCTVSKSGTVSPESGASATFEVLINPDQLERTLGIDYSEDDAVPINGNTEDKKFSRYVPETVSFPLVLDSTGVVPPKTQTLANMVSNKPTPVADLIASLKGVCYTYNGENHEPNVVKLSWGENFDKFYARTKEMSVNYTLFKPTGDPLRAKLKLKFVRFRTNKQASLEKKDNSPDMTHAVIVKEGDTLPLLCEQIYQDGSRYLEVARFNRLTDFRALKPRTVLHFPPLT